MPVRVGFSLFRKEMLEQALTGIEELLPILGVEKVILVGDMVTEDYSPTSSIDLVVIHDTDRSFGRRADFFSYHLDTNVAVNTQVYTPQELEQLQETLPALHSACQNGRIIYEA